MNISVISFTKKGALICQKIDEILNESGFSSKGYSLSNAVSSDKLIPVTTSLTDWTSKQFACCQAIVFVGATGIAVRAIAPYLKSKDKDPAVICIDELGNYVISLLSGHLGGANELSLKIAQNIGATPIISTATDINGVFAVDTWAKREHLFVQNIGVIKSVSSKMLDGKDVYLYSDYEISGKSPKNIIVSDKANFFDYIESGKVGIYISDRFENDKVYNNMLWLTPRNLHVGIGCKKGVSNLQVETLFSTVMAENGFKTNRVLDINSIDIKAKEEAIIHLANSLNVDFNVFSADELKSVKGEFTSSSFVKSKVGVDNVCERAALLAAKSGGRLLLNKTALNGVTIAIAAESVNIKF